MFLLTRWEKIIFVDYSITCVSSFVFIILNIWKFFNTNYKNISLSRLKDYIKRQKMAEVRAEKEQKKFIKDRTKSNLDTMNKLNSQRSGLLTFKSRIKPLPTFSDIVGTTTKTVHGSTVCRKALAKKTVNNFKVVEV